jgi:hypothetical protein
MIAVVVNRCRQCTCVRKMPLEPAGGCPVAPSFIVSQGLAVGLSRQVLVIMDLREIPSTARVWSIAFTRIGCRLAERNTKKRSDMDVRASVAPMNFGDTDESDQTIPT